MVVKIASIPILGDDERHGNANWLEEFEGQDSGAGPASNSIFEDPDNIKEYNDVIIAVEQPDGEKYAIARLLKDVSIAPSILILDEGSSHSNDERNTPFKEKTRCEDAQKNLPFCKDQNRLEKSEVSASELEELYPDDTDPKIACEIRTSGTPTCEHNPKNGEQIRLKAQHADLDEQQELEAATKQNEEELASNVFLASLTAEIVSFFENKVSEEGLEHCKEHDDIDS